MSKNDIFTRAHALSIYTDFVQALPHRTFRELMVTCLSKGRSTPFGKIDEDNVIIMRLYGITKELWIDLTVKRLLRGQSVVRVDIGPVVYIRDPPRNIPFTKADIANPKSNIIVHSGPFKIDIDVEDAFTTEQGLTISDKIVKGYLFNHELTTCKGNDHPFKTLCESCWMLLFYHCQFTHKALSKILPKSELRYYFSGNRGVHVFIMGLDHYSRMERMNVVRMLKSCGETYADIWYPKTKYKRIYKALGLSVKSSVSGESDSAMPLPNELTHREIFESVIMPIDIQVTRNDAHTLKSPHPDRLLPPPSRFLEWKSSLMQMVYMKPGIIDRESVYGELKNKERET